MSGDRRNALAAWRSIVPLVHGLVEGRREKELDRRDSPSPFSLRETVHHIADANVFAASGVEALTHGRGSQASSCSRA
jgi:hypothetical protein